MEIMSEVMIEQISECQKCGLCFNQKPLLDYERKCQVFWVGLSAKRKTYDAEIPLSATTNTGKIIKNIENRCEGITTYKTNLVKCLPLNSQNKLRYPNKNEIDSCFDNLLLEMDILNPKIVFLLGEKVYSSVGRHLEIDFKKWNNFDFYYKCYKTKYFVPIQHPSYIYVYKRKQMDEYIDSISKLLNYLLGKE